MSTMTTNPHAGRGGGGRRQRKGRKGRGGRGGGGKGDDERSGNGKSSSAGEDAAVAPKQSKKKDQVITPKMNNENNPPQAAGPPSARKTVSFGKNTNSVNLKNALKVGVETPCSGDNTTDQEMTSRGTDGAEIQTEKKEKTMQEKLKEVSNLIIICG